MIQVR